MIGLRRRGLAVASAAALTAGIFGMGPVTTAGAATTGTNFAQAQFAAYGTGSELHVGALSTGGVTLAQIEQGFSSNVVNSGGLGGVVTSPITKAVVQSNQTGFISYGRGSGAEVGVGVSPAQENSLQLALAQAHAPPSSGLVSKTAIPVDLSPLAQALVVTGKAAAAFNPGFCPIGQPLAFGEGDASGATGVAGTPASTALISGTGASGTQAAQSRTRTDLVANADGTFGIQNTVQEIIAPVTINLVPGTTAGLALAITVQGEGPNSPFTVATSDNGEGRTGVTYLNSNPLVRVDLIATTLGIPVVTPILPPIPVSTLHNAIAPLLGSTSPLSTALATAGVNLSIDVGGATDGFIAGPASVAYDLIHVNASVGPAAAPTLQIADVRVGHVESSVQLPAGPIACNIPVAKNANPMTVTAGNSFVSTIFIPSSTAAFADSTCDLTQLSATDVISVKSGTPTFTVGAISNGGTYNPTTHTVTWATLPDYHVGDPPEQLTVTVNVPTNSGAGVLQDVATASAHLGNCKGNATGQASLVGNISGLTITGSATLIGPAVNAGNTLPATGNGPILAWAGALLLIMAEGTRRILRRARTQPLS